MRRLTLLLLSLATIPALAAPVRAADEVVGYRGDGSCVAEGTPPVTWGTETNVAWRAPVPNWGYSSPVVSRARVFLMSEPGWKHDFPVLNCYDAETGGLLWQREVNQLPATNLTEAEQQASLATYRDILAKWRESYRRFHAWHTAEGEAAKKQAVERMLDFGIEFDPERFQASYGVLRRAKFPWKNFRFEQAGFQSETWQHGCGYSISCVGQAFPTPVTDGEHVYVATAFMAFACYDFDGNVKWMQFSPGSYGGLWGVDYCKFGRSPLLHKDLLISDLADMVRAFDKRTGALKWAHERFGHKCTSMVLPAVITCGKTDVLLSKGGAYRLPDGTPLTVEGVGLHGITRLVKYDEPNVVFFTGGGQHGNWPKEAAHEPPLAVRFTLEGTVLKGEALWSGINGAREFGHTGIVYHDGKVYFHGYILDAATGKVLAGTGRRGRGATPATRHLLWIAGGHVYGVSGRKDNVATCQVFGLDGEKVAENMLPTAEVKGEKADQVICQTGYPAWGFSYGCPFAIFGNRLYIRSNDELWCIGT